jgi:hypothetical protein
MGRKDVIRFRCWYCNRKHIAERDRIGEQRTCNCGERYRVPRRSGVSDRDRSVVDFLLEFVLYGLAGGVMCAFVGFVIYARTRILPGVEGLVFLVAVPGLVGFLIGGFFGERGVEAIRSYFADR